MVSNVHQLMIDIGLGTITVAAQRISHKVLCIVFISLKELNACVWIFKSPRENT